MTSDAYFRELAPGERFALLRDCRRELVERLSELRLPISILLSGSALYGFSEFCHGNLDDLDCNAIIPDAMSHGELVAHLRGGTGRRGLLGADEIDAVPSEEAFRDLASGRFGILRVAARIRDVSVRLHVIRKSALAWAVNNVGSPVPMLVPGDPRYFNDTYLQSVLGFPLFVDPGVSIRYYGADNERVILDDYVFRYWTRPLAGTVFTQPAERKPNGSQRLVGQFPPIRTLFEASGSLEDRVVLKGVLGDRLLMAEVLAEAGEAPVTPTLNALWRAFMTRSLDQHPGANDRDILESFSRASRFSPQFVEALTKRISEHGRAARTTL